MNGIDPQLQSIITSVGLAAATAVAGWAASKGIVPGGDQSVLANQLVLVGGGVAAALLAWWKARQQSQVNLAAAITPATAINKINTENNGVKVVPADAPVQAVNVPLKGPGA